MPLVVVYLLLLLHIFALPQIKHSLHDTYHIVVFDTPAQPLDLLPQCLHVLGHSRPNLSSYLDILCVLTVLFARVVVVMHVCKVPPTVLSTVCHDLPI